MTASADYPAIALSNYRPPAPTPKSKPLGVIGLIRALRQNPLECWTQQHFDEPIVSGGLPIGEVLAVHEPRAIRHILLENAVNYLKDTFQRRVLSSGLSDGLLGVEGERWRLQRRILAPLFSAANVRRFAPAMTACAQAIIERWIDGADGATLDASAEMTRITLTVLERTIFTDGLGRDTDEIRAAMAEYFNIIGKISALDLLGVPKLVPRPHRLRARKMMRLFEGAIDDIVATRRKRLAAGQRDEPADILTLLLNAEDLETGARLTNTDVRSNILTFIAAGQETTANALTWSLFLLSQSPQWRVRVEAEVRREFAGSHVGIFERLVETRAVIDEAMRLYPPITAISRVACDRDNIGDRVVKQGTLIVISPYVLHRHNRLWTSPDVFDPGRFLGSVRREIDRFAYLPFGAGPRTCIGSMFAIQEAVLVLATIVRNFAFFLEQDHVWPLMRVTLRPAGGLLLRVERKDVSRAA